MKPGMNTSGGAPLFAPRGQPGSMLPEAGSQRQMDIVSSMLAQAMSGAAASNSPLLAGLAPIVGSMIGSRVQGQYDARQAQQAKESRDALLAAIGGGPRVAQLAAAIDAPGAPDSLKGIATAMLGRMTRPQGGGGPAAPAAVDDGSWRPSAAQRIDIAKLAMDMVEGGAINPETQDFYTFPEALTALQGSDIFAGMRTQPLAPQVQAPGVPLTPSAAPMQGGSAGMTDDELLRLYGG